MSLADKVAEAFEKASVSMDPTDWRVFHALQGALLAERAPQHAASRSPPLRQPGGDFLLPARRLPRLRPFPWLSAVGG